MNANEPLFSAICALVDALVRGAYAELEQDGRSGRLTAAHLRDAIATYGRTLIPLPDEAIRHMDVYPYTADPQVLTVDIPLWTEEEGLSDLTLRLTAEILDSMILVRIEDIHVL